MSTVRKLLHHRDVVGFTIVGVVAIRLVPMSASSGPCVILVWLFAALAFFAPVSIATVVLSRTFPGAGGIYHWTKKAFGDLHGFIAAWTYWTSVLFFFPAVLLFTSSQFAFIVPGYQHLAGDQVFLTSASIGVVLALLMLNLSGMRFATWLHNVSAAFQFVIVSILVALATVSWMRFGSATDFSATSWFPKLEGLKDLLFISSVVYMMSGAECASQLGDEVHDSHRTVPRALFNSGLLITAIYLAISLSLLVAVSLSELSGLKGFATAVSICAQRLGGEWFGQGATSVIALLLVITNMGTVSVWVATTARLPYAIGLDRYLPTAFGLLHPRYGSPYVALITLAAATILLVVLSSLGGAAEQIYHVLISIEIVIYFIPYLYLFAALFKMEVLTAAGQDSVLTKAAIGGVAAVGFLVTAASLTLALIPGEAIESPGRFYLMVLGSLAINLVIGIGIYVWGGRTRSRELPMSETLCVTQE